jgi:hypothetical protein
MFKEKQEFDSSFHFIDEASTHPETTVVHPVLEDKMGPKARQP